MTENHSIEGDYERGHGDLRIGHGDHSIVSDHTAELTKLDEVHYPVPDPGHPEHLPRLTDVDEKAADRATRQVATFFGLVPVTGHRVRRRLLRDARRHVLRLRPVACERAQPRFRSELRPCPALHRDGCRPVGPDPDGRPRDGRLPARRASADEDKQYLITELEKTADEAQLTRRKVIGRSLLGALATIFLPMLVGLADLGPWPTKKKRAETIEATIWKEGIRLVHDVTYEPIKADGHRDRPAGQRRAGEPEGPRRHRVPDSRRRRPRSSSFG